MGYVLGIDLGTTFSAAAVDDGGRPEAVQLGSRAAVVPSVVLLRSDGSVLTGEAAERRAQSEPARTAREFKRRLGDPTPLILGGTPYGAESVTALLLKAVFDQVVQLKGEAPDLTCVTHPASYGPYKLDLLQQAVRQADIGPCVFVTEPEAAAMHYAGLERVETGSVVAVYDFGGGTFDATLLRKTDAGFEMLGQPEGMERLGGIDFDEAVFRHVVAALGDRFAGIDPESPTAQAAVARLRDECREAKEALSADSEAVIPVILPTVQTEVRITRGEFEALVAPRVRETVQALERCVRGAGLAMTDVDRVLLVGGSSRIPLVGALVRELTGRPIAVDAHPKLAIALGAAAEARRRLAPGSGAAPVVEQPMASEPEAPRAAPAASAPASAIPVPDPSLSAPAPAAPPVAPAPSIPAASDTGLPTGSPSVDPGRGAVPSVGRDSAAGRGDAAPASRDSAAPPRTGARVASAAGTGGRSKVPLVAIFGGGLTAVVAVVVAFLMFRGDGSDNGAPAGADGATATATTRSSNATSAPATAGATATAPPPTAAATATPNTARITGIQNVNGRYSVTFTTAGFTPTLPGQHVHFFFDTVTPAQAGVPGAGPWFVYGGGSPFTGYAVSERPAAATKMCILVANSDHSVRQNTGNCWDLPR